MVPEYNIAAGGWINDQTGNHWKIKDTSRMHGKKTQTLAVLEGHRRISGAHNYQSVYSIRTPWGTFETWLGAVNKAKELRKAGHKLNITSVRTLQTYCKENRKLNIEGRRTPKEWRGQYTQMLGFGCTLKG